MDKLRIEGGRPLRGEVAVSGAKNAALPILMATLVAPGEHRIANVPDLADVSSTLSLLGRIGCPSLSGPTIRVDTSRIAFSEAPYDIVRKMRASVLALGPLLARCGEALVSLPGGCAIGVRPIDQHLKGLEALGCEFELSGGYIRGRTDGLRGAEFRFDMPTVTGTENVVMAAVLAEGTSVLRNVAREPEVVDLCRFLVSLGAHIEGIGTDTLVIEGASRLSPASRPYRVLPDRIEIGTTLCAAAAAGGEVTVEDVVIEDVAPILDRLEAAGAEIERGEARVTLRRHGPLRPFDLVTEPHPGFPTDMQAQLTTLACLAEGRSTIVENIFENRFMHAAELARMGARIEVGAHRAVVHGTGHLTSAAVMASDLRASAALVIAGLAADAHLPRERRGLTEVLRIYHLDRGYDDLVGKLRALGARIARVPDDVRDPEAMRAALP